MRILYEHIDNKFRSYHGITVDEEQCRIHLKRKVKDRLLDREEIEYSIEKLRALQQETGFNANKELITDIQALENEHVEVQPFRIGEAYAEVILEESFICRIHWNENRDSRNPKGNKHGADLVGFIEIEEQILFLFGEVKTSSETTKRPPQVMTGENGIEKQLTNLANGKNKRQILISYLQNKCRHYPDQHPFKTDFEASLRTYYSDNYRFQLIGVLIRDVPHDHKDISSSYKKLSQQILAHSGLKLIALYLPIPKKEWLTVINESIE